MFYCTVYTSHNRVTAKNKTFELALCLAYSSKIDAENMRNRLLQQASDAGASTIEDVYNYRTVYGPVHLSIEGIVPSRLGPHIYSIGVETLETRFYRLSDELRKSINLNYAVKDGLRYEELVQKHLQKHS